MFGIRNILTTTALCTLSLCSCITHIDTGSMLDDIGQQCPEHQIRLVKETTTTPNITPKSNYRCGKKTASSMCNCRWLIFLPESKIGII